jgi:exosortase E/protease (VPEID-CTERM system)
LPLLLSPTNRSDLPTTNPYLPLLWRLGSLVLVYILEILIISVWLDGDSLRGPAELIRLLHDWGAWILRAVVGFSALFVTLAFLRHARLLKWISAGVSSYRFRYTFFASHFVALAIFGLFSVALYSRGVSGAQANLIVVGWFAMGLAAVVFGAVSFLPWSAWRALLTGTGYLWLYVSSAVAIACSLGYSARLLWAPAARATFALVHFILHPFLAGLTADSTRMTIGTNAFSVEIANECSGLEGIGLILTFTGLWLVLFARDYRFPNALLLIPAGAGIMFLLNSFRIAALIALGNAGAPRIAAGGFHSQAGWIAFNVGAIGIVVAARRVSWFHPPVIQTEDLNLMAIPIEPRTNFTAIFLVPFLVLLAAGMLSAAVSSDFDWLYPVRLFAAAGSLWYFRRNYSNLGWRCTWFGPAVGVVVFLVWILLDRSPQLRMPGALAASSPAIEYLWISLRVLSAVVAVPLAEELAFRGFLFRRVIKEEFQCVGLTTFTWPALVISSVLFGLVHGNRWAVATFAGAFYAAALVRRGRIIDAVVAHATTNALLAGYVLFFGQWQFW